MTPEESFTICRLAKAAFPATSVDEFTPDAWTLALEDDRFVDARDALKALMREQTFIHVSDIVSRIKLIRRTRISEFGPMPDPPAELSNDEQAQWLRDTERAVADGVLTERPIAVLLPKRDMPDMNGVFRSIDEPAPAITAARQAIAGPGVAEEETA